MKIERIISGGQTGADRGAFDAALGFGIEVGGWVPRGKLDEKGPIPGRYPNLVEAETENPAERTELNVRDSDATLILSHGPLTGGSEFTCMCAAELGRPWKHVDLAEASASAAVAIITNWLSRVKPRVLNVAGPRASEDPCIYEAARAVMEGIFMNQNVDILLCLRTSVLSKCGRWDQIRWQVPSWFCALVTVSIGVGHYLGSDHKLEAAFCLALGVFGFLCFILQSNLIGYEKKAADKFNEDTIEKFRFDNLELKDVLKISREFDFTWPQSLHTATLWFLLFTALLTDCFLGAAGWEASVWMHREAPIIAAGVVGAIAVAFEIYRLVPLLRRSPTKRSRKLNGN